MLIYADIMCSRDRWKYKWLVMAKDLAVELGHKVSFTQNTADRNQEAGLCFTAEQYKVDLIDGRS